MKLVGRKPALTRAQKIRVRTITLRRHAIEKKIAALKAELLALPTVAKLASEHGVCRATISNTRLERHVKHELVETRRLASLESIANNQEQPTC